MSALPLVGRSRELAIIEERLAHAADRGGALIVRGPAGVGKSAFLQATLCYAADRGLLTLTTDGAPAEAQVPFASLHRLLRPLLGDLGRLPVPQRQAIQAAFGLDETAATDFFLIALASLELLSEAAASAPLLLVIDNAQWLDSASCDVLMFVARRLELEPIVMLFAVRTGNAARIERAGLPELALQPLDPVSAEAVLDAAAPGLPQAARRRILAEAVGNPLALVELPRAAGGFDATSGALPPLSDRLEQAFAAQLSDLAPAVRTLLLVAALDSDGDQERILAAASQLHEQPVGIAQLAAAKAAQTLTADGDALKFHHPLVRAAVLQEALASERRAAHRVLASVYPNDPDRAVWHQAASLTHRNDDVAAELEAVAERALERGAAAVAVAALERASQLTVQERDKGRLLVRAAWIAHDFGEFDVSTRLLRVAQGLNLVDHERALLRYMLELGQQESWSGTTGIRSLIEIADQLQTFGETDRALDALELAAFRCWWENPDQRTRDRVLAAAEAHSSRDEDPRLLVIWAQADPVRRGRAVIDRISQLTPDPADPTGMYRDRGGRQCGMGIRPWSDVPERGGGRPSGSGPARGFGEGTRGPGVGGRPYGPGTPRGRCRRGGDNSGPRDRSVAMGGGGTACQGDDRRGAGRPFPNRGPGP